jgi:hypothetical protein
LKQQGRLSLEGVDFSLLVLGGSHDRAGLDEDCRRSNAAGEDEHR